MQRGLVTNLSWKIILLYSPKDWLADLSLRKSQFANGGDQVGEALSGRNPLLLTTR
jgi:hypothetical protein